MRRWLADRGQRVELEGLDRRASVHYRAERLVDLGVGRRLVLSRRIRVVPDADREDMLIVHQQELVPEAVLLFQLWEHLALEERVELLVLVRRDVESNTARDLSLVCLHGGVSTSSELTGLTFEVTAGRPTPRESTLAPNSA